MLIVILAVIGLCFGSFVNALTWRIKKKKDFVKERSECVHCGHILEPVDLIPVVSWLALLGRCRYCHKKISRQYPLVELSAALVFVTSYLFWPEPLSSTGNVLLFVTWLAASVGLLALAVYDFKWMILPNKILYPTFLVTLLGTLAFVAFSASDKGQFIAEWLAAIFVAGGIFWLLYIVSDGRWIGDGDIRLGLITGTLLHDPTQAALMIFLASVLGTLAVVPLLATGKKKLSGQLPFGPFLILATYICLLYGQQITSWYKALVLP